MYTFIPVNTSWALDERKRTSIILADCKLPRKIFLFAYSQ